LHSEGLQGLSSNFWASFKQICFAGQSRPSIIHDFIQQGRCNIVVEYRNALKRIMEEMPKLTEKHEQLFPMMCDKIRQTLVQKASRE
jgi:hypothetical protein